MNGRQWLHGPSSGPERATIARLYRIRPIQPLPSPFSNRPPAGTDLSPYFRLLNKHFYLIDDPELIHEILVTRQHEFVRDTGATLLRELVGDGLITREDPRHVERRRMMQPAFHKAQIASYAQAMIQEAGRESDEWRDNEEIDAGRVMRRLTLSVVGRALFGADFRECAGEIAGVLERVLRKSARIAPFFAFFEPAVSLYRRTSPRYAKPVLRFRTWRTRSDYRTRHTRSPQAGRRPTSFHFYWRQEMKPASRSRPLTSATK